MIGDIREWEGKVYRVISDPKSSRWPDYTEDLVVDCQWLRADMTSDTGAFECNMKELESDKLMTEEDILLWQLTQ